MRENCGGWKMGFTLQAIMLIYDWKMTFFQRNFSNKKTKKNTPNTTVAHLFPSGPAYHMHTWGFPVWRRTQCWGGGGCWPLSVEETSAVVLCTFSNQNNNDRLYLWGRNLHSIQIICWDRFPQSNIQHVHFCAFGFRAEQMSGNVWSQRINWAFRPYTV